MAKGTSTIEVQGRQLSVSSLDKVLYPADGFTKEYNKLAEEGWEFVSPLFTQPGQRATEPARTFVVFRRAKK